MNGTRRSLQPVTHKPPRWTVLLLTAIPIVGSLSMRYDQPRILSSMTAPDELLVGIVLVLLLALAGLLWMISTLRVVGEDQRWSWWIVISPAIVTCGAAIYLIFPA
ncbi:DUF1109 family protein [Rhodococcus erythropolis]|nr:DUF1109 family protein [Rhodococcus erythropolis]